MFLHTLHKTKPYNSSSEDMGYCLQINLEGNHPPQRIGQLLLYTETWSISMYIIRPTKIIRAKNITSNFIESSFYPMMMMQSMFL